MLNNTPPTGDPKVMLTPTATAEAKIFFRMSELVILKQGRFESLSANILANSRVLVLKLINLSGICKLCAQKDLLGQRLTQHGSDC